MPRPGGPLLSLVESFFRDYLERLRSASRHTMLAYRDAMRLFFSFIAQSTQRTVDRLRVEDCAPELVLAFLEHLEADRDNGVATRNARLTALRSFFRHAIRQDPVHAGQYQRILSIPAKRTPVPIVAYLKPEEVDLLLRQPDRRIRREFHHHALLLFIYNAGARVSEALAVRPCDLQLDRAYQVRFDGKGRKKRICPLCPDTAAALRALIKEQGNPADAPIFRNARGQPLTRDGAAFILSKYYRRAAEVLPSLRAHRVSPHVLRHSCAVALLQAGVDINVIRDYLGHESIATTGRYTRTNLQMKRRALEAFWRRAGLPWSPTSRWRPKPDLLAFLGSL